MVEFRLLGPVEVWAGGRGVNVGQPRQRVVLAALLVDAGRSVTPETLVDRVWGDTPPRGARQSLHAHITRIRRALERAGEGGQEPPRVVLRSGGYVLGVAADQVDVHRFRGLLGRARDPECPELQRVELLREALGLWRGEPLAGLPGSWAARTRESWRQEYPDAVVAWAYAELRVGNPDPVISRLSELAGEYPLVESLTGVLMRALHTAGRASDALAQYTRIRGRLVDELGLDPGPELQAVYQAILRGEFDPPGDTARRPVSVRQPVPAQLPADVSGFTGRAEHLADLDALVAGQSGRESTAVVISAVSGTAGVGKTALAVHWAHRVRHRFPDGQLYVNLRGFDPAGTIRDPADALHRFLDALDVPPQRIPADLDAQAALYRTLLADKRMLIVLDNARDTTQIRPLLPGAPGCLVVVTSRNQLASLVTAEGAHPLTLDLLTHDEARDLLTRRLGPDRVTAEPAAVNELIIRCARLSLALAITAARAATRPHFPLASLAAELRDTHTRLDALADTDPATDVRTVFSWSYRTLPPEAARLFRLLGVHAGPDLSAAAAASLAGVATHRARSALTELACAHLVAEHEPGRYAMHDLLRAYAGERARTLESRPARRAALRRVLDHYLHTAYAADRTLDPHRPAPTALLNTQTPLAFADYGTAMAWFTAEHSVLVAAVQQAVHERFDTHAWQLAWTLATFLDRQGHWQDLLATQTVALRAARRSGDRDGQARSHRGLGRVYTNLNSGDDAYHHLRTAVDLFDELGDRVGQARAYLTLAWMFEGQHQPRMALDHAEQALHLYRAAGNRSGRARALNTVGWYRAQLGHYQQTLDHAQQALSLHQEIGDRRGAAATWDTLGHAHRGLGQLRQAATCYRYALNLFHHLGDRYYEATTLTPLGDTYRDAGQHDTARQAWQHALGILDELGHPDADQVRDRLHHLDARAGAGLPGTDVA